jgi:flagellin-like hook-associated protein FlgL
MVTTVSTGNSFLIPARFGLGGIAQQAEDSAARIAGGNRILRNGDDAASISIATLLQTQIFKYREAIKDVATSDSLVDVAKEGLERLRESLFRAAELAEQADSDVLIAQDRAILQKQFERELERIDRIVADTKFKNQLVLDGSFADKEVRVGPEDNDFIEIAISDVGTDGLFGATPPDLTTQANAATAKTEIEDALETVGNIIGALDGAKEQLASASDNINSTLSGVSQAESAISDTDIDAEKLALAQTQLKLDIGSAIVAQASRISSDLLNVLDFKIEIDTKPELNESEDKEKESSDSESTQSTGANAASSKEAA